MLRTSELYGTEKLQLAGVEQGVVTDNTKNQGTKILTPLL